MAEIDKYAIVKRPFSAVPAIRDLLQYMTVCENDVLANEETGSLKTLLRGWVVDAAHAGDGVFKYVGIRRHAALPRSDDTR